jgi:hypothetical protein
MSTQEALGLRTIYDSHSDTFDPDTVYQKARPDTTPAGFSVSVDWRESFSQPAYYTSRHITPPSPA